MSMLSTKESLAPGPTLGPYATSLDIKLNMYMINRSTSASEVSAAIHSDIEIYRLP